MKKVCGIVGACAVFISGHASASLIGDNVTLGGFLGATSFNASATVVDPGVEFDNVLTSGFNAFDLDVFDSSFSIRFNSSLVHTNSVVQRIALSNIDRLVTNAQIVFEDVSITPTISFSDHSVTVLLANSFTQILGQQIRVSLTTVPEPATLALFGLGLAGLPFVRRRRTPA